ncbi:MAG TPA: PIN domain-containing protein [Rhizomicrobium sp.]|nr:PIN domain-containing protein [Rhizomicrobium sp.]
MKTAAVDKVVDASAIAAIAFAAPARGAVERRSASAACYAPEFIDIELAGTCLKKIVWASIRATRCRRCIRRAMKRVKIDLPGAVVLAEEKKLSLYDARCLWLAQSLRVELVTPDARLAKAAQV